jgi:hypothetical protein
MKARLRIFFLILNLVLISAPVRPEQPKEPEWRPGLAYGGAPECPEHVGIRTVRSQTASFGTASVVIVGTSERIQGKGCVCRAEIGFTGSVNRTLRLTGPGKDGFSIVDFSPDGRKILLSTEKAMEYPNLYRRNLELSTLELAKGQTQWVDAWDIFGWHECDAMVEPQGFTQDGAIILRARPSVWVSANRSRPDCVSDIGLYKTDLAGPPIRLPDDTKILRFGKSIADASQACKTDPDIIGACFKIHGRLSMWNGTPTMRIWRVGSNRILGTRDEPLPANLAKEIDWDTEAWGDFEVCPYTKDRPGVMQTVCIESAEHVFFRKR